MARYQGGEWLRNAATVIGTEAPCFLYYEIALRQNNKRVEYARLPSDRYPNRMAVSSSVVMDHTKPACGQLGGDLVLRKIVHVFWSKPISNFCRLPAKQSPDFVGY